MHKYKLFMWFYCLTFLLLGIIPLSDFLFGGSGVNFNDIAERASAETGIAWTSNLLVVIRLSLVEPSLLLIVLGSLVPALAAILVLCFVDRPGKWRALFSRFNPFLGTPLLRALGLYCLMFLVLVPVLLLVLKLRQLNGGDYVIGQAAMSLSIIPALLSIAFLDQGAVLEELGWRGFATHELQDKLLSPLAVAIVIGVCWGIWHLPRDITTGVIDRLGTVQYLLAYLPSFVLGTISISIIASFFMNKMGGSLIPAIVVHGITNDAVGLSGTASIIEALTPYHQATKNIPLACVAVLIILIAGTSLGYASKPALKR
jgi:membrane protease YdiL (CAAX protease family)